MVTLSGDQGKQSASGTAEPWQTRLPALPSLPAMRPLPPSQRIFPPDWLGPLPRELFHPRADTPLELDLGCGKGRFLLARARKAPGTDFFGVDRMLRRIRKIDNRLRREGLPHVRLLRAEGFYTVSYLLPPESVNVLWILFPDPWPKAKHESHRLFNARFLDATARVLRDGGRLEFATDHAPYFEAVKEILLADARFAPVPAYVPPGDEQTDFERFYIQSKPIGRIALVKRSLP